MTSTSLKALTATTGNRTDCWCTPIEFVGDVMEFYGGSLDLDPCSDSEDNPNVPAKKYIPSRLMDWLTIGLLIAYS